LKNHIRPNPPPKKAPQQNSRKEGILQGTTKGKATCR